MTEARRELQALTSDWISKMEDGVDIKPAMGEACGLSLGGEGCAARLACAHALRSLSILLGAIPTGTADLIPGSPETGRRMQTRDVGAAAGTGVSSAGVEGRA